MQAKRQDKSTHKWMIVIRIRNAVQGFWLRNLTSILILIDSLATELRTRRCKFLLYFRESKYKGIRLSHTDSTNIKYWLVIYSSITWPPHFMNSWRPTGYFFISCIEQVQHAAGTAARKETVIDGIMMKFHADYSLTRWRTAGETRGEKEKRSLFCKDSSSRVFIQAEKTDPSPGEQEEEREETRKEEEEMERKKDKDDDSRISRWSKDGLRTICNMTSGSRSCLYY